MEKGDSAGSGWGPVACFVSTVMNLQVS